MGVLGNPRHERFVQELHRLTWGGGKLKESRTEAYRLAGFESEETCIADNARRLANHAKVKARLAELAEYAGKIAGLDSGWALLQLKNDFEEVGAFNLDDYLGPADCEGARFFDLSKVNRDQMGRLSKLAITSRHEASSDEEKSKPPAEIKHITLDGPNKFSERRAILETMSKIAGWFAPTKVAPTSPDGKNNATLTLEGLVTQVVEAARAPAAAPE